MSGVVELGVEMKHLSLIAFAVVWAVMCPDGVASAYAKEDACHLVCTPPPGPVGQGPGAEALAKGLEAGINRKDWPEAMLWLRKAADQGNARAETNIGVMYANALGVTQNYTEAMRWYRMAADQENVRAQCDIGALYLLGFGVAQNQLEAMRWYRKAADQGDPCGQNQLGNAYREGIGVEQNYTEAMRWYRKAADQGDPCGQTNVARAYENGEGVAVNHAEALRWIRTAADQGDAGSQHLVGLSYLDGYGGAAHDEGQARAWMTKAATSGSEEAKNWLAAHPAGAPLLAEAKNEIPLCDSEKTAADFIRAENESREGLAGGLRAQALEGTRELSFDVRAQKRYCSGIGYYNDACLSGCCPSPQYVDFG
jgi:TPR repeat protein